MKVMMRLYRQHDLDLIYLYKLKGFSFQDAVKKSIRATINNSPLKITTPQPEAVIKLIELPKSVQLHIYLSPQKENDIIEWINMITKGYRNSALKTVLRNHLDYPCLDAFQNETTILFKSRKTEKIDLKNKKIYEDIPEEDSAYDVEEILQTYFKKDPKNEENI